MADEQTLYDPSKTQKAWHQTECGDIDKLLLNDTASRPPRAGNNQVIVKNATAGVNPIDWKRSTAEWGGNDFEYPCSPGVDGAGVIVDIGEGVTGFNINDRVLYHTDFTKRFGSYAEYSVAMAQGVVKCPDSFDFHQAGASPCGMFTAALALFHSLNVQPDECVLINGGAGGVGVYATQIAAAVGATVIVTCSASNSEFCKELGAHHTIDYKKENVEARIKELTPGGLGCHKVFDTVTSKPESMVPLTRFGGAMCFTLPFAQTSDVAQQIFSKCLATHVVLMGGFIQHEEWAAVRDKCFSKCVELIEAKKIKTPLTKSWPFSQVPDALRFNQEGQGVMGKHVIVFDPAESCN